MSSFCSASKLCPSLSWKPIWINRKYMYVFHSELYSSKDAETKPYAGPAMRFSGWEEHLAKLGSPLISAWCQELCLVWLRQKEGKDVMQGVYNMERFPESPAIWLVFYRDAVAIQVLNQISHTMKIWFYCPVSSQKKHFLITIKYFSLINQCFYLFSVNTTKGSLCFLYFNIKRIFMKKEKNSCSSWAI